MGKKIARFQIDPALRSASKGMKLSKVTAESFDQTCAVFPGHSFFILVYPLKVLSLNPCFHLLLFCYCYSNIIFIVIKTYICTSYALMTRNKIEITNPDFFSSLSLSSICKICFSFLQSSQVLLFSNRQKRVEGLGIQIQALPWSSSGSRVC